MMNAWKFGIRNIDINQSFSGQHFEGGGKYSCGRVSIGINGSAFGRFLDCIGTLHLTLHAAGELWKADDIIPNRYDDDDDNEWCAAGRIIIKIDLLFFDGVSPPDPHRNAKLFFIQLD